MTALLVLPLFSSAGAQEDPPLELRVNRAIARAVGYLKSQQKPDGSFPGHESLHPGGTTALAAYALVKSGVRRNDEALLGALRALEGCKMQSTYSAALQWLPVAWSRGARYRAERMSR